MKFIILSILAASTTFVAFGQSAQQKGDSTTQAPYENKDDLLYRKLDNMVAVQPTDIPQELKATLKQSRYRGWEQNKVFRSADGKYYELQLEKEGKTKIYHFDSKGKAVKE